MVADKLRLDVFVGGRILHDGADVNAALMSERTGADEGLVAAQLEIGEFGHEAGVARVSVGAPALLGPRHRSVLP